MHIGLLGSLEVSDGNRVLDVSGARLRGLLIRLAIDAPRAVSTSALIDALWGEEPPADEANALQSLVSRLRRALGDADRVQQMPAGYRLDVATDDIDVNRFARLAQKGRSLLRAGDPASSAATLRDALALWRADAEVWADTAEAAGYRARLQEQRLDTLGDRIEADLELGRCVDVIAELDELVARYPLRERFTVLLMRALAASGRQAEALARYDDVRRKLAEELGVDPSQEVQAAHLAIVRGEIAPAVGADPVRRSNLRAPLTSFVGRDEEIARIGKALGEVRLITLVGPGGAGKTRLATVATSAVLDDMPDGVWLAELAPVTAAADVPSAVLDALGMRDAALVDRANTRASARAHDATSRLVDAFSGRAAVLILDNCEHVIDAAAHLADELLARSESLRIVTTSREPLGIVGETLIVVPPLDQPGPGADCAEALTHPSVRLFADRAAAVRPEFAISDENVRDVIEIVRRLDGLPLAIELAAARLRSLPVSEIAARLSDRFRLLTGGSRTAMPRHRTLRAVVEWSWDLLSESEQLLASRLAVFAGTISPVDAGVVCSDASLPRNDIDDLLASLVDKSLLQFAAPDGRYRMLETLREFGLERLAERGELATLRRQHASRFAEVVREAGPHTRRAEQIEWMALLEAERDNILAALRFLCDDAQAQVALEMTLELSTYWTFTGRHSDAASWLGHALDADGPADSATRLAAEALRAVNSMASDGTRDPAEVEAGMQKLRDLGRRLDDVVFPPDSVLTLLRPVVAMFAEDDPRHVDRLVEDGLSSPDPWIAASLRLFRAAVAENSGDVAGMRSDAEVALEQFRVIGDRWGMASCLGVLAQLKTLDADLDGAIAALEESLALSEPLAGHDDTMILAIRLADLRMRTGDIEGARACIASVQRRADVSVTSFHSILIDVALADIARQEGDLAEAMRLRDDSLRRLTMLPAAHPAQGHVAAMAHAVSAQLSLEQGDLDDAHAQLVTALGFAIPTKDMPIVASVGVRAAAFAAADGRPEDAAKMLGAAARLRGAEDPTHPDVVRLTNTLRAALGADGFAGAYAAGRGLDAEAARLAIAPAPADQALLR